MTSLISAIRSAVRSGAVNDVLDEGEPGAEASNPEAPRVEASTRGGDMSGIQTVAGAAPAATAPIAAAAAAPGGGADGYRAAIDRISAILAADGIKGDAGRMSAAIDLAKSAPDMTAEAIVGFVTAHVGAGPKAAAPAAAAPSYEHQRLAAAALAMPGSTPAQASRPRISAGSIYDMRRNAQKGA